MAIPEFSNSTKELLAKRARYQCSNPDCGVHTVGPNSRQDKATSIGQAAHILGAKPGSARFDETMTDVSRANSANGIWLCGNCHSQIDRDAAKYPAQLLYLWRKEHEARAARELGTRGERIRYDAEMASLEFLSIYPSIVQRIAIDKQDGWQWSFTAELLKHLNKPHLKRLDDLEGGYYFKPQLRVRHDDFLWWVQEQTHTMRNIIAPLSPLLLRLTKSWDEAYASHEVEEMHDVCVLIRDTLSNIADLEETLSFANIPNEGEPVRDILKNVLGSNARKLNEIPKTLEQAVAIIDTDHGGTPDDPYVLRLNIEFTTPEDMNERIDVALERYKREIIKKYGLEEF